MPIFSSEFSLSYITTIQIVCLYSGNLIMKKKILIFIYFIFFLSYFLGSIEFFTFQNNLSSACFTS